MARLTLIFYAVSVLFCVSDAYKILVVFAHPGKSHDNLGEALCKHLLEAGHEVTYATLFPKNKSHKNLTYVDLSASGGLELFAEREKILTIKAIMDNEVNMRDAFSMGRIMQQCSVIAVKSPSVEKLLNDPNMEFDLVIVEWMFSEITFGFSAVFGCPLILVSSVEPHSAVLRLIDETLNQSYNSDNGSSAVPPFTFLQRLRQIFIQIFIALYRSYMSISEEKLYKEVFGPGAEKRGRSLPSYHDLRYNASLMLGNSHVSLGAATKLPYNYISIGGYHIDTNIPPLPADLQKIMDDSKYGVIYFSMGSNLKSKDWPEEIKRDLLKMFGGLKQTVLWKFEEVLPNLPKNVHILKWAPQHSILAHPNCKIFVTHGGLLSTTEAVHFGVPIIGIPVFGDQFINVERAVNKGFAKKVVLTFDLVKDLKEAIEDILANPQYTNKVKELSFVYHDRPVPPAKEMVHWVEHVIKTRGAPLLRSPSVSVPMYQKIYLDFIAVIFGILYAIKFVIRRLFRKKSNKQTKVKKD